jgi:hypothetical protein
MRRVRVARDSRIAFTAQQTTRRILRRAVDSVTPRQLEDARMTRTFTRHLLPLSLALAFAVPVAAQDKNAPKMTPEQQAEMDAYIKAGTPGDVHAGLAKSAGSYDLSIKSWHAPGTDATVEKGTATRTMALAGRVLVEDMSSTMMGQPFTGHGMHGYDNVTGKHWSTWNDSMSTGLMTSEGSCDASKACTFTGSWVDPVKKTTVTSRMTSRWTSPTTEVFEMYGPGPDGKEFKMMEITYTKKP